VNYAKLLELNSFFTLHVFLEVAKTQDLPSNFWQTLGDALHPSFFCDAHGLCDSHNVIRRSRRFLIEFTYEPILL
jgi:hypothetical protein